VRYWGKSGTAARYLCKGDFDAGGTYCLGFGGSTIDRRFSEELLKIISPLGISASLEAVKKLSAKRDEKHAVLIRQLEQLEYEERRAFEQYDEVDPRNRLVADELERRWNEKLEEIENLKSALAEVEHESRTLAEGEREEILAMGERLSEVWESENCPPAMKKKLIRTVVEEIIVDLDDKSQMLTFIIRWKGGSHTRYRMPKPQSGKGQKTAVADFEIIRKMSIRYGDDEIARVLNKLGRRTGKGNRWNEYRVQTVRKRYEIPGQRRRQESTDVLTLGEAAKYCEVSQTTIKRLVKEHLLNKEQIVPWAPWEIKKTDLDSANIKRILKRLKKTGKLILDRDDSELQRSLFINT
jgi:hypothetical protein